jgi:hypothetical protein
MIRFRVHPSVVCGAATPACGQLDPDAVSPRPFSRGLLDRIHGFGVAVALALLLGPSQRLLAADAASTQPPTATAASAATTTPSIPIELPNGPALPSPDEPVGGFILELIVALLLVGLVVGAVLLILELTHHHIFIHDCEECRHHAPAPQQAPAPLPEPPPSR